MSVPLFVTGLPRSGTTIMAHVLRTHPAIGIYISGREAHVLECDELRPERCTAGDAANIRRICSGAEDRCYTVFKRPWLHERLAWLDSEFGEYRLVVMHRDIRDVLRSWAASPLCPGAHTGDVYRHVQALTRACERGLVVRYRALCSRPHEIMARVASHLGVANEFDTADICATSPFPLGAAATYGTGGL